MNEDRYYDVWVCKIPKHDKSGDDISSRYPESGGRRREEGTMAAVAYDFVPYSEASEDKRLAEEYRKQRMLRENVLGVLKQSIGTLFLQCAEYGNNNANEFFSESISLWLNGEKKSAWHAFRDRITGKRYREETQRAIEDAEEAIRSIHQDKEEITINDTPDCVEIRVPQNVLINEIDMVCNECLENLSSEEAQRHLVRIVILCLLLANEIRELSNVSVGKWKNDVRLQSAFQKLASQKVADGLTNMLSNGTTVLSLEEISALSTLLTSSDVSVPKRISVDKIQQNLALG